MSAKMSITLPSVVSDKLICVAYVNRIPYAYEILTRYDPARSTKLIRLFLPAVTIFLLSLAIIERYYFNIIITIA